MHAEMWIPAHGRLFAEALYTAPGHAANFNELTDLTRSLALRPGECLAGVAFQEAGGAWDEDIEQSGALSASPRRGVFRAAGVVSVCPSARVATERERAAEV